MEFVPRPLHLGSTLRMLTLVLCIALPARDATPAGLLVPEEATALDVRSPNLSAASAPSPWAELPRFSLPGNAAPASLLSGTWTPERQVFSPDGWNGYAFDAILDAQDHPFIVFTRDDPLKSPHPLVLYWSHFDGSTWGVKARVSPLDDSWASKPRITLDGSGRLWLVWANITVRGIWYAVLDSGQWSAPARVNPPDAWSQYSPVIAEGGGEIWCTWYASTAGANHYDVFVSQWTGSAWSSPENLTYKIPGWHWFVDLAVDSQGQPHLIWGNTDTGDLLYAMRSDEGGWTAPERVNEAPANGWPFCGIALANDGGTDIMWVTVTADLAYLHRSTGGEWFPEQILFQHQGYGVAYPDIRTFDGSVSIVWSEYTGVTEAIYEVEPGKEVSRLDSGTWFYQETPVILAGVDSLWAFWLAADQAQTRATYLFSTRSHASPVPVRLLAFDYAADDLGVKLSWRVSERSFLDFLIERETDGEIDIRETLHDGGPYTYEWRDVTPTAGVHRYHLSGTTFSGATELLGTLEVVVPKRHRSLELLSARLGSGSTLITTVLSGASGDLELELFDLQGRLLVKQDVGLIGAGRREVALQMGRVPAAGFYFLRGRTGSETHVLRVPILN